MGRVRCEIDAPAPAGAGFDFRGPVTGAVTLANTGAVMSARGRLNATAVCECSRCLARHPVDLDITVNEECRLAQIDRPAPAGEGEPHPIPILDVDTVDLTELVRQALALHVPPCSLCRPDCKGLCPRCGRNLNEAACACGQDA